VPVLLKNRIVAMSCVLAVLAALGWWIGSPSAEELASSKPVTAAPAPAAVASGQNGPARASGDKGTPEVDALGTKLDAARLFDLGFAGGLTVDRDTRATLEALSTVMPDESPQADIDKLEATLRQGLPQEDAEKAIKLFHDYRSFQADMKRELPEMGLPETPEASKAYFDRVAQVQRRHFDDATVNALFGQDVQGARLATLGAFINRDTNLSPNQKKDQLDALRAQLPADLRALIPEADMPPLIAPDSEPNKP